MQEREE
jgi:hypothetical protein